MNFPLFSPATDPGPSFLNLLNTQGFSTSFQLQNTDTQSLNLAHGTTVVGAKWAGGVVMAGDRRAVTGNLISHRTIEKVFPADNHSGVAIAGAAGPALEMVKLFQLQLQHYEKLEDKPLSLEGKANQLAAFIRNNLPAAMQGMGVIPIFAGYDLKRNEGRLFNYDITGGRYEEQDFIAVGSGSLHASTVIKLGHTANMEKDAAIGLMLTALFQAADEDTGTGGADPLRGIYPTVSVITDQGYEAVDGNEIAEKFGEIARKV